MLLHHSQGKRIFLIIFALHFPVSSQAESIQEYVKNFIALSQKHSQVVALDSLDRPNVSIRFTHLDSWVHGQCSESPSGQEILINGTYWNELDAFQRELLVFHELGHCVLKRTHEEGLSQIDGQMLPTSIMHPHIMYMIAEDPFRAHSDRYFSELFGQTPNQPFIAYVREGALGAGVFTAMHSFLGRLPKILAW